MHAYGWEHTFFPTCQLRGKTGKCLLMEAEDAMNTEPEVTLHGECSEGCRALGRSRFRCLVKQGSQKASSPCVVTEDAALGYHYLLNISGDTAQGPKCWCVQQGPSGGWTGTLGCLISPVMEPWFTAKAPRSTVMNVISSNNGWGDAVKWEVGGFGWVLRAPFLFMQRLFYTRLAAQRPEKLGGCPAGLWL